MTPVECLRALLALPLVQSSARPLAEPWATAERIVATREAESSPRQVMPPIRDDLNLLHRSVLEREGDTASVAKSGGSPPAAAKSDKGAGH